MSNKIKLLNLENELFFCSSDGAIFFYHLFKTLLKFVKSRRRIE